jgi:hypothetical protein
VKVLNKQIRTKHRLSTTKKKEKSHEKDNKTNITITQQEKKEKIDIHCIPIYTANIYEQTL